MQLTKLSILFAAFVTSFAASACDSDDDMSNDDNATTSDKTSDTTTDNTNDTTTEGDHQGSPGACTPETRVGGFTLQITETFSGVGGKVQDGIIPSNVPELVQEAGSCTLLRARVNSCDPRCGADQLCANDGTCIPYPLAHDVGTVDISGLKAEVSMMAKAPSMTYSNMGTLPHPVIDHGQKATLHAAGGDYSAFTLDSMGVMELTSSLDSVLVERDKPAVITWDAGAAHEGDYIEMEISVNRHGSTPTYVLCKVEDTGSLEVAADIVNKILDEGVTGFPSIDLWRRHASHTDIEAGCVDFVIEAPLKLGIEVPGIVSCGLDEDCPDGQTCSPERLCI